MSSAAEDVDEEALRLIEVGNGEAEGARHHAFRERHPGPSLDNNNHETPKHIRIERPSCQSHVADWIQSRSTLPAGSLTASESADVKRLEPGTDWVELLDHGRDWKAADPALLATMLGQLLLIRAFEETVLELAGEEPRARSAHSSIGQEGGAVGSIVGLRSADAVNGSHRGHHQFLAKAMAHVSGGALDLDAAGHPDDPDRAAPHARRDPRARPRLLPRPRRIDAPAVVRGRRPRHERDRRRRRRRWRPATPGRRSTPAPTDLTINYFGDGASQIGSGARRR